MIHKIQLQDGVTFYSNEYSVCKDIDVSPDVTTLHFKPFVNAELKGGYLSNRGNTLYDLYDVKKQFPNVKTLVIDVIDRYSSGLHINNMMFPNVKNVISHSPSFRDGTDMLIKYEYNHSQVLLNAFCKQEDETIDMEGISSVEDYAFEGCKSTHFINTDNIEKLSEKALCGSVFITKDDYSSGLKTLGNVIIGVEPGIKEFHIPQNITEIYDGTNFDDIQKMTITKFKQIKFAKHGLKIDTLSIQSNEELFLSEFAEKIHGVHANNIEISDGNKLYCSVDGVVFSKDKKILVGYPGSREGSYDIPEGTETIWCEAFKESNLSAVSIPDSVTDIQSYAFAWCNNLTSVKFGKGIANFSHFMRTSLFSMCKKLHSIEIPSCVDTICEDMFSVCPLDKIILHEGIKEIKNCAFNNCNINDITLPDSLKWIGNGNFSNASIVRVKDRIPYGLIADLTKRWNDNYDSEHPLLDELLFSLVITENGGEKTLYIPRYLLPGCVTKLDELLSNCSWRFKPESYYNTLYQYSYEGFLQQETAMAMYAIHGDEETRKFLKEKSRKIINRLVKNEDEEKLIAFLKFGLLSERVLDSLFKTAQNRGLTSVTAYILAEKDKLRKKNKKTKTSTSFRI